MKAVPALRLLTLCAALIPVACGSTRTRLPVALSQCRAGGGAQANSLRARVRSEASKPIRELFVGADFYRDFRYVRLTGSRDFKRELDPGQTRDVAFALDERAPSLDRAIECLVTRVDYLDGTTASLAPAR